MNNESRPIENWVQIIRDAATIGVSLCLVALLVNIARSDGLPLMAKEEYEILVPCPEPLGEIFSVDATSLAEEGVLVIDARNPDESGSWRYPGALSIPFDFLDPVNEAMVTKLIQTRAKRIVVFGDGGDPDSGRELGRELGGRGARNVFFVEGGAPVLQKGLGGLP